MKLKEEGSVKDKGTKHPKEMEKEALLKDKKDRKPGELKDEELEKLSGGAGMNTGNIINP
jgi:hypothetical protein